MLQDVAGEAGLSPVGPLTILREFVLMNRAAVGLGVFLHPKAELNFHALFEAEIEGFIRDRLEERQAKTLKQAGLR